MLNINSTTTQITLLRIMKRNFNFELKKKKKTNCAGHDAGMYIYFANCMTLCFLRNLKLDDNVLPREI